MDTALVTGGSGDIGAAICLQLASQGLFVNVHTHKNRDKAQQVVDTIESRGGRASVIQFDLRDREQCEATLHELLARAPIDVLVNNAAVVDDSPLIGMSHEAWHEVIDVSLNGFFRVTRTVLPPMIRKRRGRIINISSVVGLSGGRGQTNYAAAKGGLQSASRSLALELAARNITVNVVAPGIIDGGMAKGKFPDHMIQLAVPMQRAGRVEEVAHAVGFLASDAASYITGQTLSVNGGMA